jgi:hypothetical protein
MATLPLAVSVDVAKTTISVIGTIQNCDSPGVITIDSEDISFTGCSEDQFVGCVRGANATTPAVHNRYAEVTYTQNPVVTLPIAQPDVTPVQPVPNANVSVGTSGSLSFTNVSADIGSGTAATNASTILVPSVSGLYLLSFYGIATSPIGGGDAAPNLYMGWTDEKGTQKYFYYAGNLDPVYTNGANQVTFPVYAMAGKPIWMGTTAGVYATSLRFSLYFTATKA